jgi:hypothetical protein
MNIHSVYAIFQNRFRPRRMRQFVELFGVKDGTRILDVGGSVRNWNYIPQKPALTLVNMDDQKGERENIKIERGDARALTYKDNAFEIAYSNSVIEHVGKWEDQKRFAEEIRRVAPHYYVQTPYKWFPIEPHFIAPLIHYLPKSIHRHLTWLGAWYWTEHPNRKQIDDLVEEIELLDVAQMQKLFPDAEILRERFLGLTKSLIAVRR